MRWGRRWGTKRDFDGRKHPTFWGGEQGEQTTGRVKIVLTRGRIVPCDSCKRRPYCEMFKSFTRSRMRSGEYLQGTNVLHMCDIYAADRIPGDIRIPPLHSRAQGGEPT